MGKKGLWISGILLAVLLLAAGVSQVFFLARHPYFRKYAAQCGLTLREAREAWGRPDTLSEQMMGLAVEASLRRFFRADDAARDSSSAAFICYNPAMI